MARFYLLPSRTTVGEHFAQWLASVFPGSSAQIVVRSNLADALEEVLTRREDVYVVFAEELPEGEDPSRALAEGFGAERGDEIVDVRRPLNSGEALLPAHASERPPEPLFRLAWGWRIKRS